jgi:hypothetical protein
MGCWWKYLSVRPLILLPCHSGAALADGIAGVNDADWRLFHENFPPRYNCWPFGRMGAGFILVAYAALDELRIAGLPIPQLPTPW